MRIDDALRFAARQFARRHLTTPFLDAEVLLAYALKKSREYLAAHPEQLLTPYQSRRFRALVSRRAAGEPVAYLRGYKEFYGLPFRVTPSVLIPRPETESLVEMALGRIPSDQPVVVADLGTGSGNIAITIAKQRPHAAVWATDRSRRAINIAKHNARQHRVSVRFRHGDLLFPLKKIRLDIVLANLPYGTTVQMRKAYRTLRYEPAAAIAGGPDGLAVYRRFLQQMRKRKNQPHLIICEMEENQIAAFTALARESLPTATLQTTVVNGVAITQLQQ
ncbi:MAG: peptide chain release factor N(5)-glutamine methyltransferase [Patescibacteria group bacterium]|nr:peptide chain release factor N(5)-glutamine methyltransferase [Patescibacteria group bacterium]